MIGKMERRKVYLACLPKQEYNYNHCLTAGWRFTKSPYFCTEGNSAETGETIDTYRQENMYTVFPRIVLLKPRNLSN